MGIASKPWPALAGAFLAILAPAQGVAGTTPEASDFEGYPVASNQELDALRGGFEINIGGQLLSLAFSLERVSYLNGELLALTRISVPDLAAAIVSPGSVSVSSFIAQPATGEAGLPASGEASPPVPAPQVAQIAVPPAGDAGSFVTLIQNGPGNSVALPADLGQQVGQQVSQALDAAQAQVMQAQNQITVIQNTLDNQVISNFTTLNVTLTNAALARAVELNAALQSMLNRPIVLPR